jgi:serine/threonine-protein kinase
MLELGFDAVDETRAPELPGEADLQKTPLDRGRFVAGTVLAGRYRVVGLLGRGGMGDVYKAEDLKVQTLVALKFLPEELSSDGAMQARFHREVRAARQITHPNVCRVHDMGEIDTDARTLQFLSMEYIDGEDLSTLLRRIGHLPISKGLELARQLCSGLAAAHEAGVVHRDLKPANIMLDGRGRARIMDFGLSRLAEELKTEESSGTPAYMAPEQLRGAPATTVSDIYALGLVLYEIFTGKRPFEGRDLRERQNKDVPPPSTLVRSIDPLIDAAILRCLSRNPDRRPKSPYEIAAALPGGDPLAAALAAGETPSPEMVAASGNKEGLRSRVAWALLGAIVTVLLVVGWVLNPASTRRGSFEKSPEMLAERARTMLNQLGYPPTFAQSAYGVTVDDDLVAWAERDGHLASSQPGWIRFWYRESPEILLPELVHTIGPFYAAPEVRITKDNPPLLKPGMLGIVLDSQGQLLEFTAIPSSKTDSVPVTVDPALLFTMAGLDPKKFTTVKPERGAIVGDDKQEAWIGNRPEQQNIPLRVEAGFSAGRPAHFAIVGPWSQTLEKQPGEHDALTAVTTITVVIFVMLVGGVLAWKNLRTARSDRRGAFRLSLFAFSTVMLVWLLGSDHQYHSTELNLYLNALGEALVWSALAGVMYLAIEPFSRHRWPRALISWNRLMEGRFNDSLVARHVLVGIFFAALVAIVRTGALLLHWSAPELPDPRLLEAMQSNFRAGALLIGILFDSANIPLALLFLLTFLRAGLRNQWVASVLWIVLINALTRPLDFTVPGILLVSVFGVLWLVSVMRFGLTAGMAMWFADRIFRAEIMLDPHNWYAERMILLLAALAALSIIAFKMSLGSQPALRLKLLEG